MVAETGPHPPRSGFRKIPYRAVVTGEKNKKKQQQSDGK